MACSSLYIDDFKHKKGLTLIHMEYTCECFYFKFKGIVDFLHVNWTEINNQI